MRRLTILAAFWAVLHALPVWGQTVPGQATAGPSAACGLLAAMVQADRAVAEFADLDRRGAARVAIADALASIRQGGAVAGRSGVAGFDAEFIGDFVTARDRAVALMARGAAGATALADPVLRRTATRLSQLYLAFDCATEVDRRAAVEAVARLQTALPEGAGDARWAVGTPARRVDFDPEGRGRFVRLRDFGGNRWRVNGNPDVWRAMSVFLLVFAVTVTLLNWLRSAYHRRSERFPCALDVLLVRDCCPLRARLLDLSHVGAKVKVDPPPYRGDTVLLKWRQIRVEARVVWANRYFAGLVFLHRLDDASCAALLAAGRPDRPGYTRPGDPARPATPDPPASPILPTRPTPPAGRDRRGPEPKVTRSAQAA